MKKIFLCFLLFVGSLGSISFACSPIPYTYHVNTGNNSVYLIVGARNKDDSGNIVSGADGSTWQNIHGWGQIAGKDKNHVYVKNSILSGADPKTYTGYFGYLSTDQNWAYFHHSNTNFSSLGIQKLSLGTVFHLQANKRLGLSYLSSKGYEQYREQEKDTEDFVYTINGIYINANKDYLITYAVDDRSSCGSNERFNNYYFILPKSFKNKVLINALIKQSQSGKQRLSQYQLKTLAKYLVLNQ